MKRILVPVLMFLCFTTLPSWNIVNAPWRSTSFASKRPECYYCQENLSEHPERYFILAKRPRCFIALNPKPYVPGHIVVVPHHHTDTPTKLSHSSWLACWDAVKEVVEVMSHNCGVDSFNIGMNVGTHSGASQSKHLHIHIVPRYKDKHDGWMEIIAHSRMLDEMTANTYKRLKPYFQEK